ncbi:MAG TPA: DinB family protein [Bryobacteraceae bacterium]|nr:DinB family protein [Bryobacteraceae bacterium]
MSLAKNLSLLYRRDLARLMQQVDAFPGDESLWRKLPGITNPAGNLVLHLEGNLREYIGRQLGGLPYERVRPLEFSSTGLPKENLTARLSELRNTIPSVIERLSQDELEKPYPEQVLEIPLTTQEFLIHIYGHLNWHLGELDYLRRALSGSGALERIGLQP